MRSRLPVSLFLSLGLTLRLFGQPCLECHKKTTPNIVSDWQASKHSLNDIDCSVCHGEDHRSASDFAKAKIPTPETCAVCHETQVTQFKKGKHAFAWAAMKAMPTAHAQPVALMEGMKGCGVCNRCHSVNFAKAEIEQELFVMYLEHRMRSFQGTFHANPDYALWYGWSEMRRSLKKIETMAAEMRRHQR